MSNPKSTVDLVGEFLDHAANGRWDQLPALMSEDFVILEPESLPYGGEHHGSHGYIALMKQIGGLFELQFDLDWIAPAGENAVVLRMVVTFTSRQTGRSAAIPVVELLTVREGRLTRSEIFHFDTAALPCEVRRVTDI
jgi:ketosteroid isomerase-like protein